MFKFIRSLWQTTLEPWKDGSALGKFCTIIGFVCWVSVTGLLVYGGYFLLDRVGTPQHETVLVTGDKNEKTHPDTILLIQTGRVLVPHRIPGGTSFTISLVIEDQPVSARISRAVFENLQPQQKVNVIYSKGRLSGTIFVRSLEPQ